jgi:cellulose synthase/poly-beta-1,6-N-acetylglucosamine synthase-like glycosyltransferase
LNPLQSSASIMGASIVYVIHTVILPFLWRFCGTSVFCGSAELVRRDLLEAGGKWREGSLTEDIDYTFRVYIRNQRIGFADDVECESEVPHNFPDLFRQQMRWAYGVTRCFVDHGAVLLTSGLATGRRKLAMMLFGSGYLMTAMLVGMLIIGFLKVLMPLLSGDAAIKPWPHQLGETVIYIFLSSGLLITSLSSAAVSQFGWRAVLRLLVTSYTVGVVLMLYVVRGMCIALTGKPMKWFMLKKAGNEAAPSYREGTPEGAVTAEALLDR